MIIIITKNGDSVGSQRCLTSRSLTEKIRQETGEYIVQEKKLGEVLQRIISQPGTNRFAALHIAKRHNIPVDHTKLRGYNPR